MSLILLICFQFNLDSLVWTSNEAEDNKHKQVV